MRDRGYLRIKIGSGRNRSLFLFGRHFLDTEHGSEDSGKELRAFQYNDFHMYAPFASAFHQEYSGNDQYGGNGEKQHLERKEGNTHQRCEECSHGKQYARAAVPAAFARSSHVVTSGRFSALYYSAGGILVTVTWIFDLAGFPWAMLSDCCLLCTNR